MCVREGGLTRDRCVLCALHALLDPWSIPGARPRHEHRAPRCAHHRLREYFFSRRPPARRSSKLVVARAFDLRGARCRHGSALRMSGGESFRASRMSPQTRCGRASKDSIRRYEQCACTDFNMHAFIGARLIDLDNLVRPQRASQCVWTPLRGLPERRASHMWALTHTSHRGSHTSHT